MGRWAGWAFALGTAVWVAPMLGCAASDGTLDPDGSRDAAGRDAGVASDDAGPGADGAAPMLGDAAGIDGGALAGENTSPTAGARGCYDFEDSDGDRLVDCEDVECSTAPICCLGSSAPGCCTMAVPATGPDFSTCTGAGESALAACEPDLVLFGLPRPDLRGGTVVPNGGERFDSGLLLPDRVDPRVSVVHARARIRAATTGTACAGCVDFVGFGITSDAQMPDDDTVVEPDVALIVNNAQRQVRLLVGGVLWTSWSFATLSTDHALDAAELVYEIEATPGGTLTVRAGAAMPSVTLASGVPWSPAGPARVIAYGRTANPGGADPPVAALLSVTVGSEVCDAPASIERATSRVLPETADGWWRPTDQASGASVVEWNDGAARGEMAFVFEGRIHHASRTMSGGYRADADPHDTSAALLVPDQAVEWRSESLSEPELVRDATGWTLYFTATSTGGRSVIGRAIGDASFTFGAPEIFWPLPGTEDGVSYDGPSHLEAVIGGTMRRYLAMRRTDTMGSTELVLFEIGASGTPARADAEVDPAFDWSSVADTPVHREGRAPSAFDFDEVASPALVAYRGVLRMYYAGRRGTRWSIGMLASEDGRYWRLANEGAPILTGSGGGYDALSVSEPEPVWIGSEMRLFYTGFDGVRSSIVMGHHLVPEVSE